MPGRAGSAQSCARRARRCRLRNTRRFSIAAMTRVRRWRRSAPGSRPSSSPGMPMLPLGSPISRPRRVRGCGPNCRRRRSISVTRSLPMTKPFADAAPRSSLRLRCFAKKMDIHGLPGRNAPMKINGQVQKILSHYESDNPGTKANLARILMHGKLGGTGKLLILPVDQGVEHGPARSFAPNPPAYDPHYHWQLAIEAGLSAFAAPLGFIEGGASTYAGQVPTILKVNGANSLSRQKEAADQAVTA